jgi:hypothetical protein
LAAATTIRIAPHSQDLLECVETIAHASSRPVGPLRLQALLQLPRVAEDTGFVVRVLVDSLLQELTNELPALGEWSIAGMVSESLRTLQFQEIGLEEGREVMARFHYLRSPRLDGRIYGLRSKQGKLIAICVSSPLDVRSLDNLLNAEGRLTRSARVLSRVFAFEGAPRNTISYLLSRAGRAERKLGVTDWVSYVNPNMGFNGVSYLASGWHLLGEESGTTYRYLDNRYITDRELAARFGAHDDAEYGRCLGDRFTKNRMPLAPLLIFGRVLSSSLTLHTSRDSAPAKWRYLS